MLLNKQAVRQLVAIKGRQTTKEFLVALDRKVSKIVEYAAENSKAKRLTESDLY